MEGYKNNDKVFQLVFICFVLIFIAGTVSYFSRNLIPYEIKVVETSKFTDTTTETPTTTTTEKQFDVLEHTLGTAIGLIKEAPKFVFSFGSKLLSVLEESNSDADDPELNVFSVVGRKNSE